VSARSKTRWALLLALLPASASAQSLGVFLAAAPRAAEVREADAVARQREAERTQAMGRLLPAVTARLGYTRNQYEVGVTIPMGANATRAVITPENQLDATLSLDVPLLDLGAWSRYGAAREGADGARVRVGVATEDVRRTVARQWFTWVAATALRDAATRALEAADRAVARTRNRAAAGAGSALDVLRAESDAARARQRISDAELSVDEAARVLHSVTGVEVREAPSLAEDDLHDEGPLGTWTRGAEEAPSVRAAQSDARVSDAQSRAAWFALAPTVSATATQRWTNAAGFGPSGSWAAGVSLAWRFDVGTLASARAQQAADEATAARLERTTREARDAVSTAWNQVRAGISRARAARAEEAASEGAARTARERLTTGAGTELEALLAERDAFSARVSRVQADADLGYARVLLRIASARPIDGEVTR
jgi:outer membrane protein TolC